MRVKKEPQRPEDLFKSRLDPILKTGHPLNRLANSIDRDYRGNDYDGEAQIHIAGKTKKSAPKTRSFKKWLKRRNAIEPIIGHLKSDNRIDRNYLEGTEGDRINAILAGCGANLRKLIKAFLFPFFEIRRILISLFRNTKNLRKNHQKLSGYPSLREKNM